MQAIVTDISGRAYGRMASSHFPVCVLYHTCFTKEIESSSIFTSSNQIMLGRFF